MNFVRLFPTRTVS